MNTHTERMIYTYMVFESWSHVSVSLGYYYNVPQTRQLINNINFFLMVLKARSLR